jgi:hypothetical protein
LNWTDALPANDVTGHVSSGFIKTTENGITEATT